MTMDRENIPEWAEWIDEWTVNIDGNTGYLMTVDEFKNACEAGLFIDYDGMGDLIIEGKIVTPEIHHWPVWIKPSKRDTIPEGVTHVLWYNR